MEENQETIGILMSSIIIYLQKIKRRFEFLYLLSLIVIINYYKKLRKTKKIGEEMKDLHFIYLHINFDI